MTAVSIGSSAATLVVGSGCTITSGMVAVVVGKTLLVAHCWQCGEIETNTWARRKIGSATSDRMNMGVGEKICTDDTLIISVILKDYGLDHMFTKHGFHCDDYWTAGIDNGAISQPL
uniref:Uncharacterized protein n=1 Tax=Romanomermis culicivorax TaxID=13658 RepID=A0A915HUL0_ROMCU